MSWPIRSASSHEGYYISTEVEFDRGNQFETRPSGLVFFVLYRFETLPLLTGVAHTRQPKEFLTVLRK